MNEQFKVEWIDRGREPQCPPNPAYPNGKPLRLTDAAKAAAKHCKVDLPYPAKRCGVYVVKCSRCGLSVGITTAGRPDDPTYIELACGPDTALQLHALVGEPYVQDGQIRLDGDTGAPMSTKSSIKWKHQTAEAAGYHLYDDVMDQFDTGEPPIYLRLDGVAAELCTQTIGVSVTVTIPRWMARELGLIRDDVRDGDNGNTK